MKKGKYQYFNRELSWLDFNTRVLQEANDSSVPLISRLHFIGIFSNNLDEFFRVRYATIKRLSLDGENIDKLHFDPNEILEKITQKAIKIQTESLEILNQIHKELQRENIFIVDEKKLSKKQEDFIRTYFIEKISPAITTIILDEKTDSDVLKDYTAYLAVKLHLRKTAHNKSYYSPIKYALIDIPSTLNRFVILPKEEDKHYIILIEDIIRYFLSNIFSIIEHNAVEAHMIKMSRDAFLDIEHEWSKSFIQSIISSAKERSSSEPVRFVYDKKIAEDTLSFFMKKMHINNFDSIIPGGRYHNRRDYMKFPTLGRNDLIYSVYDPLTIKGLDLDGNILQSLKERDYLQHTPYHTFAYIIKFLRESAIDPKVKKIKITAYRLASISNVVNSLVNAQRNGKEVTILIEVQARFDEEANIKHGQILEREGIKTVFGIPGLKVHSKVCVVEREENNKERLYGFISTGNFNESSAKSYTDYTLLTSNQHILKDVNKMFDFFDTNYKVPKYKHLIVSPHYTKLALHRLINQEIKNARKGLPSYIKVKLNSLSNHKISNKLYEASRAGVKIKLIVRGICCLVPKVKGFSENIEVISIVDKYLEHTRVFIFGNNDDPKVYISSADWMTRNIINRVEVSCPIYDKTLKNEIIEIFDLYWEDNVKARIIEAQSNNNYRETDTNTKRIRAQIDVYNYYKKQLDL